jgi:hypothetical protein
LGLSLRYCCQIHPTAKACGLSLGVDRKIKPRYYYFKKGDYLRRYHRFAFNKQKLIKLFPDLYQDWMSEWDMAKSAKMDRIWDCGKMSFEFFKS